MQTSYIYIFFIFLIIFVTFFSFILFFNIVFLKIQPLLQIFNLCFLVFVINFVPLRTQSSVPIFIVSEITGLIALSSFGFSFFSTRSPLSPPSPFSSLPNSVNLFEFQTVENTQGTDYWQDLSLSFSFPPFILLATSVSFLTLLFSV